jgi:lysophospholipase L1-like esterase
MKNKMAMLPALSVGELRLLSPRAILPLVTVICALSMSGGCSSSSSPANNPTAGSSGGQSAANAGTSGSAGAGGVSGAGGLTVAGGIPNTGGSVVTGGAPNTGGLTVAGGSQSGSSRAGGIPNTGGATIAGGSTGTGGLTATGGVTATGGQPAPDAGPGGTTTLRDAMAPDGPPDAPADGTATRDATGTPDLARAGSGGGGSSSSGGAGGSATGGSGNSGGSSGGSSAGGTTGGTTGGSTAGVPLDPTLLSKCTGTNPINCAFTAPNGNYTVTVELGSATAAATTRVLAETRRIVLQPTATAAGAYFRYTFAVNVRAENHDGYSAPGNILNLSFDGTAPALHGVGFAAASIPTIYIAGDSTVCDWDPATYNPFAPDGTDVSGWAQELSQYMGPGIAVANYADSGETASSFYGKFYPPAKAAMKQGDYLFVQFGHNDMKSTTDSANYSANLLKYVTDAKAKNATPVLITPVARSGASAANHGFNGLDQTMITLAKAQNVAYIDLTTLALTYYGTLSSSAKSALFVDGTHFHEPGATQIANLVAQAMKGLGVGLEVYVK